MEAEDILWVLPYVILIAVLYSIYLWKTARGKKLLAQGRELIRAGNSREGVRLLKEALWKANQKPDLELAILDELVNAYKGCGVIFDAHDYIVLVNQFRELNKKGSGKAVDELKKVQKLKKQVIDRMKDVS